MFVFLLRLFVAKILWLVGWLVVAKILSGASFRPISTKASL